MRIATWNIGGGYISSKDDFVFDTEQLDYFSEQLNTVRPDILFIQEAHIGPTGAQSLSIGKAIGLKYHVAALISESHLKANTHLSLAVLSRYKSDDHLVHALRNPRLEFEWRGKKAISHDKGLLETRIAYNGTTIRALCSHMVPFRKFGKSFADDEYRDIRTHVEEIILTPEMPTIVGADMNHEDIESLLPRVFAQGFTSIVGPEATTPKGRRYDKILLSPHWTATPSTIVKGRADHYLCVADVELQK